MYNKMFHNIPITPKTKESLIERKIHKRETWDDIVVRLIECHDYLKILKVDHPQLFNKDGPE